VTPNLIEPMATKPCICATCIIEQKVREACGFTGSESLTTAEMEALLNGVARVFVEVTARLSEPEFNLAMQWLVIRRESLQSEPSVMIHTAQPMGRA
jgi:hypothetical protein